MMGLSFLWFDISNRTRVTGHRLFDHNHNSTKYMLHILGNGTLNNKLPGVDIYAQALQQYCFPAVNEVCFDDFYRHKLALLLSKDETGQ